MSTPWHALRAELARDPARPLLTFYDDTTGERVELSVATFDNWVAKTANLLQEELAVGRGKRVALLLPPHWQATVWLLGCWAVGAVACADPRGAALSVAGPDAVEAGAPAGERVALALRPLGGRFTQPLPAGVRDYAAEVPGQGDRFVAVDPPGPADPAVDGVVLPEPATLADLVATGASRAAAAGTAGARVLVEAPETTAAGWAVDAVLVPLLTGGSAVLVRHADPAARAHRLAAERAVPVPG